MDIIPVSLTTATSGTAYIYSDPINLTRSKYKEKQAIVKVDISGSAVSGVVTLVSQWCELSGGTYTLLPTILGGTSVILTSGTSASGELSNGSHAIPLYNSRGGTTIPFVANGWLKLGVLATKNDSPLSIKVIV